MITLVEPQEHVDKLWGKQRIKEEATYRMLRYVLRVNHDDKVLLHNVVTGRLVVLEHGERDVIEKLPLKYEPVMEQLVEEHYLVPENYDDHLQVKNLRSVLRMVSFNQEAGTINMYTILPTTACNARCYYCFERGMKTVTMSERTADDVIRYIVEYSRNCSMVSIVWFGGEPTLATERIEQICAGLSANGIHFVSSITTNAYLFDDEMIHQAKTLWNLETVNISMDGAEERYNSIKSYVNPKDNPYQRVMRNVGLLLNRGIRVNMRMNFDKSNYDDFYLLINDCIARFAAESLFSFSVHQINDGYENVGSLSDHGDEAWFNEKILELNSVAREAGVNRRTIHLPSLVSAGCKASNSTTTTITAEGNLVRCPEQFGDDQIVGNVRDGIVNHQMVELWKGLSDYEKCQVCELYPRCLRVRNCSAKDRCCYKTELMHIFRDTMIDVYKKTPSELIN